MITFGKYKIKDWSTSRS